MFIRQKLFKTLMHENVTDVIFFIEFKIYFLSVLSKRWIWREL